MTTVYESISPHLNEPLYMRPARTVVVCCESPVELATDLKMEAGPPLPGWQEQVTNRRKEEVMNDLLKRQRKRLSGEPAGDERK
jgi:hypothetical protein